ncbi:MAG TPA: PIG-L family deacetylase [Chitinophagaceae bacterium]|nr:PIG-L family deacetylase [Chitinophagaceae bacterium]
MKRRRFINDSIKAGSILPAVGASLVVPAMAAQPNPKASHISSSATPEDIVIEKFTEGRPHAGKVFAAIQPHCDDIAIFAGGTVAKLIAEGYTGYMIRTSNDDATGAGKSVGEQVLNNEIANDATAAALGLKKVYNLGYRNHRMEEYNIQEIKGRLIFLFRLLKVDTVICYDPWSQYEENPDHYVTAKAVEAACWEAASRDYPEQLEVLQPHGVREKYYFARGPQLVNRVVDISRFVDTKVKSNVAIKSQGPGGDAGANLRKKLAAEGKSLSILGNDDTTANFNYVKHFMLDIDSDHLRGTPSDKIIGKKYGLEWAEQFHYIGPTHSMLPDYIKRNS